MEAATLPITETNGTTHSVEPPVTTDPPAPQSDPAVGTPVDASSMAEPDSWERVREDARKVDPALADRIGKMEGALRRDKDKSREVAAAKEAVPKQEDGPSPMAAFMSSPLMKRVLGLEDGDPYEGIDVGSDAPDYDALVTEPPDDALTDKAALKGWLSGVLKAAGEKLLDTAHDRTRKFTSEVTRLSYAPIREVEAQASRAAYRRQAESETRALGGMADETAYMLVYNEAVKAVNENRLPKGNGVAAFKATWASMAASHPEWLVKPVVTPNVSASPTQPAAKKEPEVVRRPDPFASMRELANRSAGAAGSNARGGPSHYGAGVSEREKIRLMAASPEFQRIQSGDLGGHPNRLAALDALEKTMFG